MPALWLATMVLLTQVGASLASTSCNPVGSQQEMNACAIQDYKVADTRLNRRYQETMKVLTAERREALRDQQRAWLRQRDPVCAEAVSDSEGGSIWTYEYYTCLATATKRRSLEFGHWVK